MKGDKSTKKKDISAPSDTAKREEEILHFWTENRIFEKTLEKDAPKGDFVFYDGPPFATGLPHVGNLLSSIIKDVIPRYKTMCGYRVRRRWGWDCHGLPIESLVEKKLGLKSKKEVEDLGVEKFNEAARSLVLEYAHDWERYVERVGRWVDFKNAYKTMDNSYIESVWWALSEIYKRGLLYEGRKVLMYCPHCETPLSKAEIAMDNSYEDVTEEAVTVKFKLKKDHSLLKKGDILLAWTTTPWTLPGNVALAVSNREDYSVLESKDSKDRYIAAKSRLSSIFGNDWEKHYTLRTTFSGKNLIGAEYEPLYEIEKVKAADADGKAWKVYDAPFVSIEEGTGIVHTAVIYGEDDFALGNDLGLPMVPLLDRSGRFNDDAPALIQGRYFKYHSGGFPQAQKGEDAEFFIKSNLEERELLFDKKNYTHSYPHCYRCGTPLIYNAISSWFINIQKVKEKMLSENEKVNWIPDHLKHGRFQNIVENAPDWTISRNRYWASPLPIWKREGSDELKVIGSLDELKRYTKKSGNVYTLMRHGEAESNAKNIVNSRIDAPNHLTDKGKRQVQDAAENMQSKTFDLVLVSPLLRTRETADIVRDTLGISKDTLRIDERLRETGFGVLNEGLRSDYWDFYGSDPLARFHKAPEGGETMLDVKRRVGEVLYELERVERNKRILIVAHKDVLWMLTAVTEGAKPSECMRLKTEREDFFKNAEVRALPFVPLPHNKEYELDLHRPYIDDIELFGEDGSALARVPEVVDCWVESGSMPFAEWHYPMENKALFESRFPGDYIAEYIAQTRTWFYYMHAMGVLLFDSLAFKNVVSTGNVLAADGSKMSKSKGNYTDPLENIDQFGADALRFYLMASVVMQAEDLHFRDEEMRDVHNRVVNILWNTYKFYDLYKNDPDNGFNPFQSTHVLDRWVLARLHALMRDVGEAMDQYDTARAARPIADFINDFSTWYIRRSRERFKGDNADDKRAALVVTRHVFLECAKIIAPFIPFLADSIYRGADGERESVHLETWPQAGDVDDALLSQMAVVREIVSRALELRASAGIKVRQPLSRLTLGDEALKGNDTLLVLIKDEINVKEIDFDTSLGDTLRLDTVITEGLKREGDVREFIRFIQDLRKKHNHEPHAPIYLTISTDEAGEALLREFEPMIKRIVLAHDIVFDPDTDGEEFKGVDVRMNVLLNIP